MDQQNENIAEVTDNRIINNSENGEGQSAAIPRWNLVKNNLTFPTQLSILRVFLSPVFLFLFLSPLPENKFYSFIVLVIASLTDWYDGWHARKFGVVTKFGIFIDPLADKILTSCAFIGFYILGIMPLWMIILIVLRDIFVTLLRSYHEYKGHTLKTSYIAKVKTFAQMTYMFVVAAALVFAEYNKTEPVGIFVYALLHSGINNFLALVITLLTVYTGISYIFFKK